MSLISFLLGSFLSVNALSVTNALEPPPLSIQKELQRQAVEETILEEDVEAVIVKPICETIYEYGCSCMIGLQNLGYPIKGKDAKDLQSNVPKGYEPVRGDIILFKYPKNYHAAAVAWVLPSGNLQIYECNYRPGKCGTRVVLKDDKAIRGYITNPNFGILLDKTIVK